MVQGGDAMRDVRKKLKGYEDVIPLWVVCGIGAFLVLAIIFMLAAKYFKLP